MQLVKLATIFKNSGAAQVIVGNRACELAGIAVGDTVEVLVDPGVITLRKRSDAAGTIVHMEVPVLEGDGK